MDTSVTILQNYLIIKSFEGVYMPDAVLSCTCYV